MNRRSFIAASVAAGAATTMLNQPVRAAEEGKPFKLLFAPHFGMFKSHAGPDKLDQLQFMYDQGFRALEHNGMMSEPVEMQEKIAAKMSRLGMTMGVFIGYSGFGKDDLVKTTGAAFQDKLRKDMGKAVEVAKRVNARWCTVVPASVHQRLSYDYQMANSIENLKVMSEVCEKSGLVMVMEPLNWKNHPGLFLQTIGQAYQICNAVNSPSCKILDDLYHQQISEGDLIPNIDLAWKHIAYIQIGDNPGRKEPNTGEINFKNVFKHIHQKGFKGIYGMEHGNSKGGKEGELAVIKAYREVDLD